MKLVYFTHSLASCWNHGNAHFLRGVIDEWIDRGHEAAVYEPEGSWSLTNLLADHGEAGLAAYRRHYPQLSSTSFPAEAAVEEMVDGADVVIVHEWNEPGLVAQLGLLRKRGERFLLLFHDTHHRAVSAPEEMRAYDLSGYDGVLAFGETLAEVYRGWGWGSCVWTWHEAADIRRFRPPQTEAGAEEAAAEAARARAGLVWIGNWGDGERTEEIQRFLLAPARDTRTPLQIHGVRYPREALALLERFGASYGGWAPNADAPEIFGRYLATIHVPRRYYASILPGIPTIRVFEALACGIPLISAPWCDAEQLFRPGEDFLLAYGPEEMTRHLEWLKRDSDLRRSLVASGLQTIRARHTCAHRVDELLGIIAELTAVTEPARRSA